MGRYVLRDPLVYVSNGLPDDYEATCIDLWLDVGESVKETAASIGRISSYAKLSPNQRANYLCWLSCGRVAPLDVIGYALLFFFGLERRYFRELSNRETIVQEILRLLEVYPRSQSLEEPLERFLAFSLACQGTESNHDQLFNSVVERLALDCKQDFLPIVSAWFYKKRLPLPGAWALTIARRDPLLANSTALVHQPKLVQALFKIRYQEKFAQGLSLKASSADREVHYSPINPSLASAVGSSKPCTKTAGIPDVLGVEGQFSPLVALLARCIEDLPSSTREKAKGPRADALPEPPVTPTHEAPKSPAGPDFRTGCEHSERLGYRIEMVGRNQTVRDSEITRRTLELRWCGNAETVTVGAYVLKDPMVYVSEGKPREDEASCIDMSLEIGKPVREAAGSLGYYPTYAKISPNQRANYLRWLSNGRVDPLHDIGYAFLFFYGLERRLSRRTAGLEPDRERSRPAS